MAEENLPQYLTELVCTRISHDVIGNVGAVANAVELLEEGDLEFLDEIRSILNASSKILTARLKFFRMAFGLSNSNLADLPIVREIAAAYLKTIGNASYPINLELDLKTEKWSRAALLSIMILADVLIKGGNIGIREIQDGLEASVVSAYPLSAEKIKVFKMVLSGEMPENQAQAAPVVYLQKMLNNTKKIHIIENNAFGFIIR